MGCLSTEEYLKRRLAHAEKRLNQATKHVNKIDAPTQWTYREESYWAGLATGYENALDHLQNNKEETE